MDDSLIMGFTVEECSGFLNDAREVEGFGEAGNFTCRLREVVDFMLVDAVIPFLEAQHFELFGKGESIAGGIGIGVEGGGEAFIVEKVGGWRSCSYFLLALSNRIRPVFRGFGDRVFMYN